MGGRVTFFDGDGIEHDVAITADGYTSASFTRDDELLRAACEPANG